MTPRVQGGLKTATAPTTAPPTISDRDVNRVLALCAGIAILAGPRATRPLAGFLYGAYLSRIHGAQYRRLHADLLALFDQRRSVTARVDDLAARVEAIADRVERVAEVADVPGPSPLYG
jgi:hypothetical protein